MLHKHFDNIEECYKESIRESNFDGLAQIIGSILSIVIRVALIYFFFVLMYQVVDLLEAQKGVLEQLLINLDKTQHPL